MKRQKALSDAGYLDGAARGKKGNRNHAANFDSYEDDYEDDDFDADEWEDSFDSYNYQ